MAYADITVYDDSTSVLAGIYDLEHNRDQYDRIVIELFKRSGTSGSWTYVGQGNYNPPTGTYKFQTHTFTNQDIQWYYYCEVNVNYQGTWYDFTSSIKQMPKQEQSPPVFAPTLSSRTQTSITLNSITNGEYLRSGWFMQSSTLFTGLSSGTAYVFAQRFAETSTHLASEWSPENVISTLEPDPIAGVPGSFTAPTATTLRRPLTYTVSWGTSSTSSVTYRLERSNNGGSYSLVGTSSGTSQSVYIGNISSVRFRVRAEKSGYENSNWQYSNTYNVDKANQSAPPDPSISSRSYTWIQLNSISGNTTPEYRIEGGSYGTGRSFDGLSHGTSYWFYQRFSETDFYFASPASSASLSTLTLTVGNPSNINVTQSDPLEHKIDISWTGGSNATGHDIRWSNTTTMPSTPQFENLSLTSYSNVDLDSFGDKYIQVRARRTVDGQTVFSSWVNASPYPINLIESPQYNTVKVYVGSSWQSKPVKYHDGHTWVQGNIKYHDGSVWK